MNFMATKKKKTRMSKTKMPRVKKAPQVKPGLRKPKTGIKQKKIYIVNRV